MCYEIPSENFLANYFASSEQNSVSLPELKDLRRKIELKLNNQVYIDLTYESLIEAEEKNPSLFLWEDDGRVFRRPNTSKRYYSKRIDKFNWHLPKNIMESYRRLIIQYAL
jgi:hypothetical protein